MSTIVTAIRNFARDEEGITAIEYGLIAAVMAVTLAAAFDTLGDGLDAAFTALSAKLLPA